MTRDDIICEDFGAAAPAITALVRNFRPHINQPNDVLASFYANTKTPRQAVLDWLLKRHAVPVLALAHDGDGLGVAIAEAYVEFDDRGRFEFLEPPLADDAERALIVVARDESAPLDLIAWAPKTDRVATYNGLCAVLGAHMLADLGIDQVVQVQTGLLGWLKAGRTGIVIIDPAHAWRVVDGDVLGAADVEHGLSLRRALQPPAPRIVIPNAREAA